MRVFVAIAVVVALVMVGVGFIASRGSSGEPNPVNTAAESTPPSTQGSNTENQAGGDAAQHNNPNPDQSADAFDDERCVRGDLSANSTVSGKTIVIDPGHGGEDLGTVNTAFDITESELVLPISEKLRDLLLGDGAVVCLTRIDDTYIGLAERAYFANEMDGDAFISMHLNSLPDPGENYTMTMWGNEAKDRYLAERILESLRFGMAEPDYFAGESNPIHQEVYLIEGLDSYMLKTAEMPAVLVEASFLSNNWEARAFVSGIEDGTHWREHQIADLVHLGILDYFETFR
jgi:N-acetylmuramoyl-L-alanine amidase